MGDQQMMPQGMPQGVPQGTTAPVTNPEDVASQDIMSSVPIN